MTPEPKPPDKLGILLRVGLFVIIGVISLKLFALVMEPLTGIMIMSALSAFGAAAVANAITVRIYERGRLSDLGLGWTPTSLREFLMGAGTAMLAGSAILLIPIAAGFAYFEPVPSVEHRWASFAFVSMVLLFGAAGEEMLFHGYAFQLLIRSIGPWATILPASAVFGLAHLGNPNATLLSTVNTVGWGVLLGYAYLRTQALWLPIGLHFGWNFALPLFGVNLSGFTMGVTGYELRWRAGTLWSGGGYGPEGSLLTTIVVVALFFAVPRVTPDREEE